MMTRDRVGSGNFRGSQHLLGTILGERRVGVTKAAHALKQHKLIDYKRGNIAVLDGRGLQAVACSCYEKV